MAISDAAGEFSMTSTGVTVSLDEDGNVANQVNLEGTATGYGTVLGTLTFTSEGPDAKAGTTNWIGQGYLDNGDIVAGMGDGVFEEVGKHKWRVRALLQISSGGLILTEGEMNLDGRTYTGTIHNWT